MANGSLRAPRGKCLIRVEQAVAADVDGRSAGIQLPSGLWAPATAALSRDTVGKGTLPEDYDLPVWYNRWASLPVSDDLVCVRNEDVLGYPLRGRDPIMEEQRVLLRPVQTVKAQTDAGILLTEHYREHFREGLDPDEELIIQSGVGEVAGIGAGVDSFVVPGAYVLFNYRHAVYVEVEGTEHVIVRDDGQTILAVMTPALVAELFGAEADDHRRTENAETDTVSA